MAKKKLNDEMLKNELKDSVFFNKILPKNSLGKKPLSTENENSIMVNKKPTPILETFEIDITNIQVSIQKASREKGTYRLTKQEKQLVREIVFTLTKDGFKTSENELFRMGLNLIFQIWSKNKDYFYKIKDL
jgi:hypothetical protein